MEGSADGDCDHHPRQTTVRDVVGRSLLDQVLTDTETLDESIEQILDRITQQWGVHVLLVERAVRALSQFEGAEGAKVEPATRSTVRIDPGGVEVF